jgi:hypothetical protein
VISEMEKSICGANRRCWPLAHHIVRRALAGVSGHRKSVAWYRLSAPPLLGSADISQDVVAEGG